MFGMAATRHEANSFRDARGSTAGSTGGYCLPSRAEDCKGANLGQRYAFIDDKLMGEFDAGANCFDPGFRNRFCPEATCPE